MYSLVSAARAILRDVPFCDAARYCLVFKQ